MKAPIELAALLGQQWTLRNGDPDVKMVQYCLKKHTYIDIGPYYLEIGSKPGISSDLWYSDVTEGPDDSKFESFYDYNMRGQRLDYDEIVRDHQIWVYTQYSGDRTNGKIKSWTPVRFGEEPRLINGSARLATDDDIMAVKQGLNELKENYEKRLKTYWKKYSHKVYARGYWADR